MKTIDVRITGSDDVVICPSVVRDAVQNDLPEKYFTVTELPPPQEERSCENCGVDCSGKINSEDGDVCYKWQPAAPVAPAVESNQLKPAIVRRIWVCPGCQTTNTESDILCKQCNTARQPVPCQECEKLRAENDKLMDQLRNAEDYIKELNQPKGVGDIK